MDETIKKQAKKTTQLGRLAAFGFGLIWIVTWPVVMGVIAVVVLLVPQVLRLSGISIEEYMPTDDSQVRLIFVLFEAIMVIFCLIFITLLRRSREKILNISAAILTVYMWAGIALGAVIVATISDQFKPVVVDVSSQRTEIAPENPDLKNDPRITAILGEIGAEKTDNLETKYVGKYQDASSLPDQGGEYTSFVDSGTGELLYGQMTVKKGLDPEEEKIVIAHEYLHHIWYSELDETTKENLSSHLISMYGNDLKMHEYMQEYADNGRLYPTELFSYYCTESSDQFLTTYVLSECQKFIKRDQLVFLR